MVYAAAEAKRQTPAPGGQSEEKHLRFLAKRGHVVATKLLEDAPPFPEALSDLWDRFQTLSGMRGVGMHGPLRLTPSDIEAANRLFDWNLQPHEVRALTLLDIVTLAPDALNEETV